MSDSCCTGIPAGSDERRTSCAPSSRRQIFRQRLGSEPSITYAKLNKAIHAIEPKCQGTAARTMILLAEVSGGGFLSGGAAGMGSTQSILFRAVSELLRHALAVSKVRRGKAVPQTFYEKRVSFFGLGEGDSVVHSRLAKRGDRSVILPTLRFDTPIPHDLGHLVAVHRCYFENQPLFMGGKLERLCV